MNNKNVIFFFRQLKKKIAGGSKAVLDRANYFSQQGYSVTLAIIEFSPFAEHHIERLRNEGGLHKNVNILFLWELFYSQEIMTKAASYPIKIPTLPKNSYDNVQSQELKHQIIHKYYLNGILYFRTTLRNNRFYIHEVFDINGNISQKWKYFLDGKLFCIEYYDKNSISSRDLYANGYKFLSIDMTIGLGRGLINSEYYQHDITYVQLLARLLDKYLPNNQNFTLIADGENISQHIIREMKHPNINTISVLHNNHTDAPYTSNADIKSLWKPFLTDLRNIKYVVCLTKRQEKDLHQRFPELPLKVIQHAICKPNIYPIKRKKNSIIFLGRLAPQKQSSHLIEVFRLVKNSILDAEFHIYGEGSELPILMELVNRYKLSSSVFFHGFTNDPLSAFASCSISLMTSFYEGFPLTFGESMSVGTPFVTYDINYGPDEIIQNGINGIIVPQHDIMAAANAIIDLFKNPKKLQKLSKEAKKVTDYYTIEKYMEKWLEIIK